MRSGVATSVQHSVRIAGVATESVVDGPGLRSVIFFQGCPHACPGCHNPETWDPRGGLEYPLETVYQQLTVTPLTGGITFSGGEPFLQAEAASRMARFYKERGFNIWIYTGFVWEDLVRRLDEPGFAELLETADVIVDGPFRSEMRDLNLAYRGSANQRIIRVKESLRQGQVVHWVPSW